VRAFRIPVIVIITLLLAAGGVWAFQGRDIPVQDYREGEVLVKYRSGVNERDRGMSRGLVRAWKTRKYRHVGVEKLSLGAGLSAVEAVELLNADPNVEYAELNWRVEYLAAPRVEPNDPGYTSGDQWYLDAPLLAGSHIGTDGTVFIDIDIDAPEAWAVMEAVFDTTMAASVGVIDSGCGENGFFSLPTGYIPNHQDLPNSSLWLNPVEAADPGTDSPVDPNSLIDDVNGWDFLGEDNTMADELDSSAPYHGTHISGIIAGQWDTVGVAGIGRDQVKVLPLRASFSDEIIGAIDYAIETSGTPQVRVLNASWKFGVPIMSVQNAIEAASNAGIAFVAAAGNGGNNNDVSVGVNRVYPAQYTRVPLTNLLAVAATGLDGSLASFSNYGPESVQIAAPGVGIYSPGEGSDGYSNVNGTSFSAPIAASVLALVMAANPALSPAEAIDRLIDGGDFDARLAGQIQSGKRINLAGALAPFAPYSGPAPMDTLIPVSLYADTVSALYGSISNAISDSPSVAVLVTISGG
jgi:serine protease